MMNRTHFVTGACAFAALAPVCGFGAHLLPGAALAAVAATLPDIDHPKSKPSRALRVPLWRVLPHRGPTHHLWSSVALAALLWPFGGWSWWTVALVLGWTTHHLGDMATMQGLRWLWPLPWRFRGPIRTGGKVEWIVLVLALCWLSWLLAPTL